MDPLVSLKIVVPIEALGALVASEWSIICRVGVVTSLVAIQLLHLSHLATVHGHSHLVRHAADERELPAVAAETREVVTRRQYCAI
jgi:hypothetical protein